MGESRERRPDAAETASPFWRVQMTDLERLQATNIVRLQAAARMAGLRWKNGDPGTDKAGLIARLSQHPSILRATLATLERMARGENPVTPAPRSSLADDLADDAAETMPSAPTPVAAAAADMSAYALKTDLVVVSEAMRRAISTSETLLLGQIKAQGKLIEAFQQQRPIQYHFPNKPEPITVNPAEHHSSFPKLIQYLQINRRVILVGAAGTGKSIAVKNAADVLGVKFHLQPPVTMSHELIGHRDAQGQFHPTPLFEAYTKGGLILMDEADACLPDALLCANPIFDGNGFATFGDGELHQQHPEFFAVFNMNTDGFGATMQYAGRNRLDGATLARFGVRIDWRIDPAIEARMCAGQSDWHAAIVAIREFMVARDIQDVNATPRHVKTGAALLNAGASRADVLTDCICNGAVGAAWSDIIRLPAVAAFLRG